MANKSGGCAFPGRGKYLNRRALTRERGGEGRVGEAIKRGSARVRLKYTNAKVKFSFRSFDHTIPSLRSVFDETKLMRLFIVIIFYYTNLENDIL